MVVVLSGGSNSNNSGRVIYSWENVGGSGGNYDSGGRILVLVEIRNSTNSAIALVIIVVVVVM